MASVDRKMKEDQKYEKITFSSHGIPTKSFPLRRIDPIFKLMYPGRKKTENANSSAVVGRSTIDSLLPEPVQCIILYACCS